MELDELKLFLKVEGSDQDVVVAGYQLAAEQYLQNAGVAKDYSNAQYKIIVTILVGVFFNNPDLVTGGKGNIYVLPVTLNGMIAQMRLSQVTI